MQRVLLVRYGEVAVKGPRTRRRMERLLVENLRDALRRNRVPLSALWKEDARIIVTTKCEEDMDKAVAVISRVFGVVSVSPAYRVEVGGLEEVVRYGVEVFASRVAGRCFRVNARRSGAHNYTSMDIAKRLGRELLESGARCVNLRNPEVTVYVEVRGNAAFYYTDVVRGPGGLPIGSEGDLVAMVSGGIDSPVAAWLAMKRGARVHVVFFNLGGREHEEGAMRVIGKLIGDWAYGYDPLVFVVDYAPLVGLVRLLVDESLWGVVLRRLMFYGAELIARKIGALGIVTGESLGQVSSQTLHNIMVASAGVSLPILRPLIGFDKDEIVALARKVGTYEESAKLEEFCALVAGRPTTRADPVSVDLSVLEIGMEPVVDAVKAAKVLRLDDLKRILVTSAAEAGSSCPSTRT